MTRHPLERRILRAILADLGHEPDLLLLRNLTGFRKEVNPDGTLRGLTFGLGTGSPDLVGLLRISRSGYCTDEDGCSYRVKRKPIGVWFCLEVKRPGEKLSDEQKLTHRVWSDFGAWIRVVESVEEARAALTMARNELAYRVAAA